MEAKYDAKQLASALSAIKNGMPVATAGKTYNIPRTTLRHKVAGRAPETISKRGPDCLLGKDLEDKVCKWLKDCSRAGFPVNKEGLLFSVQKLSAEIYKETGEKGPYVDKLPGKTWYLNFMKRHPELSNKQSEYLNKARATVTEEKLRSWFRRTLELLEDDAEILRDPTRCWNMDESAFYTNPTGGCVIAEKGKPVYGTSSNSDKENVTTLITVNANGEFAPPLTLYKFERIPKAYFEALPTSDWGIGKSKNGWMTADTFLQYFRNVLYPFFVKEQYKFPMIIFLDGHSSHLSIELTKFCKEHSMILVCLYPNSTHILQPLDVSLFYPLKVKWKKEISLWKMQNENKEIKKQYIPSLLHGIITRNSFEDTIKNGFRACGLYPFNEDNVDYTKCLAKSSCSPQANVAVEEDENKMNFYLKYFESKIEPNILSDFKNCKRKNEIPKATESLMLFEVWCSIKADSETSESTDIIEFPFPEFEEFEVNSNDNSLVSQQMANITDTNCSFSNINLLDENNETLLDRNQTTIGQQVVKEEYVVCQEEHIRAGKDLTEEVTEQKTTEIDRVKEDKSILNIPKECDEKEFAMSELETIIDSNEIKSTDITFSNDCETNQENYKSDQCIFKSCDNKQEIILLTGQTKTNKINDAQENETTQTHTPQETISNQIGTEDRSNDINTEEKKNTKIEIILNKTDSSVENRGDYRQENNHSTVNTKKLLEKPKKVNILSNVLVVPRISPSNKSNTNKRDPFMSVLTHEMWIKIQEEKAEKALEIEKQKEERKRKREERKSELEAKRRKSNELNRKKK